MTQSLGRQISIGGLFLVALRLSIRLIGLVSVILLFRILTPDDFGVVALAMIVVGLTEVLSEFGFDQALLRKQNASPQDYHLTWSLNLVRGSITAAVLVLTAIPAAHLFGDVRLTSILYALAVVPLLDGVSSVGVIDFAKNLQFDKEFRLRIVQKIVSFFVTLGAALLLKNYWALIIGTVTGRLVSLIMGYWMHPYRPRLRFEGSSAVFKFSIWILLDRILLYCGGQADKVIAQRLENPATVGVMRVAEEISSIVMELVWPVEKALTSGYVRVLHDLQQLRELAMKSISTVAAFGIPLSVGLGILAQPTIALVLGDKGLPAIPFVQGLVIHGAIRSAACGVLPMFVAIGEPRHNTHATLIVVAIRLLSLLLLVPIYGIIAAPYCLALGSLASFCYIWRQFCIKFGLSSWILFRLIGRILVATAAMALVGVASIDQTSGWHPAAALSVCVPLCALTYVGVLLANWHWSGRPAGIEHTVIDLLKKRWDLLHANPR